MQEIGRLCNEEIKPEDVLKIVRIGKKDGSGNPRPTLVKFVNHEKKRKLFRNIHKLSGAKSVLKVVNANHDLKKDQRARERNLKAEANRRQEQDLGECQYRVRGPPWDRKVVKVVKRN